MTPFPRLNRQRGPEVVGERDDNVEGQTQSASRLPSCPIEQRTARLARLLGLDDVTEAAALNGPPRTEEG